MVMTGAGGGWFPESMVLFRLNYGGRVVSVSPSIHQVLGWPAGKRPDFISDILSPSNRNIKALEEAFARVKSGGWVERTLEAVTHSGAPRTLWFHFRPAPEPADGGAIEAAALDVSAVNSESSLSAAMDQSPASMVITDPSGVITWVNRKFTEVTGYSRDEAVGKAPADLKSGLTPESDYRILWEKLAAKKPWRGEFLNRHENGELYWESASIAPILDARGHTSGYLGVKEDVTAKKRAEESLDSARRALIRANRALMAVSDVNREMARANDETAFLNNICKIMVDAGGYKMAWIGLKYHDDEKRVIPAAQAGVEDDYLKNAGITWADEPSGRGPTGTAIRTMTPVINRDTANNAGFAPWREEALRRGYASSAAFPIIVDGISFGALMVYSREKDAFDQDEIFLLAGLAQDTGFGVSALREREKRRKAETERMAMEERVRQTQRMESLELLAGGVAHDFNNLLTSILVNLDLAQATLAQNPSAQERLRLATEASRRSAQLCHQMLTFAGKGSGAFSAVDMNRAISGMTRLLSAAIPKNIRLILDLSPQARPMMADGAQISQALMNLITNAAQAIGSAMGAVTIRTREVQCAMGLDGAIFEPPDLAEGPCLLIEVADNGPGMDAATAQKAFDPFFTTKPAGKGLGLAVVLGIIKSHGGAISLQSSPGRGATFRMMFPAAPSAAPTAVERETRAFAPDQQGSGTILVIEDEEHLRNACQMVLKMAGYKVLLAENGREGMKVFFENSGEIGLVLLDLSMPVMDGGETLGLLEKSGKNVAVVLTSGYDKSMESKIPKSRIVTSFLAKPYSADQLIQTVQSALRPPPK
jgi:PAS domain S-box-containing protein